MYQDRTQNYDPEIHEEYFIHEWTFRLGLPLRMRLGSCYLRLKMQ